MFEHLTVSKEPARRSQEKSIWEEVGSDEGVSEICLEGWKRSLGQNQHADFGKHHFGMELEGLQDGDLFLFGGMGMVIVSEPACLPTTMLMNVDDIKQL
ncbi:hypothetical protein CHS0354_030628 [Potamilus streckersoni]|uniref:Uncharacterized protein n=1 Tax=Potamilus streckersoni TaxID=2493646 RepID=A0AAE0VUD4_9BIVA|nr:hypothetical protein CHS0354_030628 [Potamilus streckersoni]